MTGTAAAQVDPATEPTVLAVQKAMPAVVNINTERIIRRQVVDPFDVFFNDFFGRGAMRRPRQISQKVQSLGSGFIVDPEGYIVTNEHVVERAAEMQIKVTTTDGKTYDARYITGDPLTDLAFIKIEDGKSLPCLDVNKPSPNLLGQTVLVLGNPLGYGSSVARGILSANDRDVTVGEVEYKNLVQTDAAINPGNSGGPLIDLSGRLVGVSSVKLAFTPQGVPTQGLGFAIPAATVREKVAEFRRAATDAVARAKTAGQASRVEASFGLQLQEIGAQLAAAMGVIPGRGVLISNFEARSPAAEAGLKRGLVIYRIGRYEVNSLKEVEPIMERVKTGTIVDFTAGLLGRDGRQQVDVFSLTAR